MIPITDAILERIGAHEGFRAFPYMDCCGKPWRECLDGWRGKLTIGYGHNLDDVPISLEVAEEMERDRLDRVRDELETHFPWANALDPVRQEVLYDLGYNLGVAGLLKHNPLFLAALERGDYVRARMELLGGSYEQQTGERARANGRMIETGVREPPPPFQKLGTTTPWPPKP